MKHMEERSRYDILRESCPYTETHAPAGPGGAESVGSLPIGFASCTPAAIDSIAQPYSDCKCMDSRS